MSDGQVNKPVEHEDEHSHSPLSPEEQEALDELRSELTRIANEDAE